jgi:phosphopantothenoylcysteine decarboxylase/phosphopantothenate--cysteine ligase
MAKVSKVLIGITGGIAAYKIPYLVRLLRKNGCEVKVVLTPAARPLVGEEALRTLSGHPVYVDGDYLYDMGHIRLSEWADVFLICPATANTVAKIACGIADNLLTTLTLSIPEDRIIVAPAMNSVMWESKATRANIETLSERGFTVLPVEDGELACGASGPGRMLEVEEIARYILTHGAESHVFKGKNILISSGPTEEPLDPVRVITNRSSGRMGAALAKQALLMGARVTVVSGPAHEPLPMGSEVVSVRTAAEMERELTKRFSETDVCIMAAAVSDYKSMHTFDVKLNRSELENITLELALNPDIVAKLGAAKDKQFLVGFSLESGDDIDRAEEKMKAKNCDMMVFNRVDVALGGHSTGFALLFPDGRQESFPVMDKSDAAREILTNIAQSAGYDK